VRARRHRIAILVVGLVLLIESLRPTSPAGHLAELLCAPFLLCTRLIPPLPGRAAAALAESERVRAAELALESRALLSDLARATEPTEPGLREGKRLVHGLVLGRDRTSKDRLRVRLRDLRGVVPGLPVACGDAYVGRVFAFESAAAAEDGAEVEGTVLVELVTAKGFRVGARVAAQDGSSEVLMTVGGLVVSRRPGTDGGAIRLAVDHPSSDPPAGLARVHELFGAEEPLGLLAEGLRLGTIQRDASSRSPWIAPELDFKDGLSYVVVLAPSAPELGSALAFEPDLLDDRWVRARTLGWGDPSPWRGALPLSVGERDGVRAGAAVTTAGARLVGRIERAGGSSSELSFLDDPGLALVAVARFAGIERPVTLGRLIALGRDGESLRFRWIVRAALPIPPGDAAPGAARPARLYTGAGEEGLPAGFFLGEASLPVDVRPGDAREIRVRSDFAPDDAGGGLFVRLGERGR
jgi:hypothetical protein